MDSKQLKALRDEGPVDFVEGRILPSYKDWPDMPTEKPSQLQGGKVELCQDIVLELVDRTKVMIAFWDLSQRCFSKNGKMDEHVAFDNTHVRKWIRVRDTNPRDKHSLSRRTKGRAPEHYKKKHGIDICLKATPTVAVEWMLEEGEQAPRIGPPRRVKKLRELEAPGSKKSGGANKMSSTGVPGGRTERRPSTTTPPAGPHEQKREQAPTEGAKPQGKAAGQKPSTPREWLDLAILRNAAAHHKITGVLREHYIKQNVHVTDIKQNIHVTDQFLAEATKTIHTQLVHFKGPLASANTTLISATGAQITYAIDELCYCYFLCHMLYLQQAEARKEVIPTDDVNVRTHVTTVFIGAINTYPINLPR